MEGLGVAASVLTVIELSAKIALVCVKYSRQVKHAAEDINRLQREVKSLQDTLQNVKKLLDGPSGARLSASPTLSKEIDGCGFELTALDQRLNPSKSRKAMSRVGFRALKWPFESKAVYEIIGQLERRKQSISLALQVDQTILTIAVSQKIDLLKLPLAEGAEFDSYADELDARCHPETRVELRRQIREWADNPQGKCIFWLCGIAGTGKSTISRTVAQSFADKGQLGGSFFFKRGEGDRGNASRFFTTITAQLVVKIPTLLSFVSEAIEADPSLTGKSMKEQFEKLLLQPLSKVPDQTLRLVIVIDALDECEREGDINTILLLLAQVRQVASVSLGIFVTSRPELPVRLGFKIISGVAYQDMILHEIPRPTIEHDISAFLKHEFGKIRNNHNHLHPSRVLPSDWPGEMNLKIMVDMAIPLFIFAATVCRYVGDIRWDPQQRLRTVLKYQTASQASKLDRTYFPILNGLLTDLSHEECKTLIEEFQYVVGSIILLVAPLSIVSLARLFNISEEVINSRLDFLHSVLSVPTDQQLPVRLLHLSFREFLIDPQKQSKSPFWVDEKKTHKVIATKCLELMSNSLKENICDLKNPGIFQAEIERQTIDNNLPAEIKYACCHWVYHLERGGSQILDHNSIYSFLSEHLLHWLEALSLVGRLDESIAMIPSLISLINLNHNPQLANFLFDARRFVLKHRSIIEIAPLQVYSSALIFTPKTSFVRTLFKNNVPSWILRLPEMESTWDAELQTLEGHTVGVTAVGFSPDGQLLASASYDRTVRLWDPKTGTTVRTLEGHTGGVTAVGFSPDGQLLASASYDGTVRLWDPKTGTTVQTLEGHTDWVTAVGFSPDGQLLASASDDRTVRLWDPKTGTMVQTLEGHTKRVTAVGFSPDGQLLASASHDGTVRLWDPKIGTTVQTLGYTNRVTAVGFSPNSQLLASASHDGTVRLWDPKTGTTVQTLEGHTDWVTAVGFSPDGQLLASASHDGTVRLWDPKTGTTVQTLEGHTDWVTAVGFSPDGQLLASASWDGTVRLWDPKTGTTVQTLEGHTDWVTAVGFSPDGQLLVSASDDRTVRLWDPKTGTTVRTLEGHTGGVTAVGFSPDGQLLASASYDGTVRLWDPKMGTTVRTLKDYTGGVTAVGFSTDGQLLASASWDRTVRLWDPKMGTAIQTLKIDVTIQALSFSIDGSCLETDRGLLDATTFLYSPDAFLTRPALSCGIFVTEQWVVRDKDKLLWLPPDYRPTCMAVRGNTVVLGHASGRMSFLEFAL